MVKCRRKRTENVGFLFFLSVFMQLRILAYFKAYLFLNFLNKRTNYSLLPQFFKYVVKLIKKQTFSVRQKKILKMSIRLFCALVDLFESTSVFPKFPFYKPIEYIRIY